MPTKIEWAEETWNPITGCTPVSEGCANCYAERMARRLAGRFGYPEAPHHFDVTVHEDRFAQPLRWKKPRRIFVCSMGDLFHESIDFYDEYTSRIFETMTAASWHQFLVLTKRPERMLEWARWESSGSGEGFPCGDNILLGVTAENQARADERIPILLSIPAAGHFVSLEPMLGAVDFDEYVPDRCSIHNEVHLPIGRDCAKPASEKYYGPWLDWVILGGESGPGARPTHPEWVRSVRDQCQEAGVAFHFKQWGAWVPPDHHPDPAVRTGWNWQSWHGRRGWIDVRGGFREPHYSAQMQDAAHVWRVGKKAAGRLLDGREWNEYPEACQ